MIPRTKNLLTALEWAVFGLFLLSVLTLPCLAAEGVSLPSEQKTAVIREDGSGKLVLTLDLIKSVSADSYEFSLDYDSDVLRLESMDGPVSAIELDGVKSSDRVVGISSASSDVAVDSLGTLTFELLRKGTASVTVAEETSWINAMATADTTDISPVTYSVRVTCAEPGNINGDGAVDLLDIVRLMKFFSGKSGVLVADSSVDVNGDGQNTSADIVRLVQFIANPTEVVIY